MGTAYPRPWRGNDGPTEQHQDRSVLWHGVRCHYNEGHAPIPATQHALHLTYPPRSRPWRLTGFNSTPAIPSSGVGNSGKNVLPSNAVVQPLDAPSSARSQNGTTRRCSRWQRGCGDYSRRSPCARRSLSADEPPLLYLSADAVYRALPMRRPSTPCVMPSRCSRAAK